MARRMARIVTRGPVNTLTLDPLLWRTQRPGDTGILRCYLKYSLRPKAVSHSQRARPPSSSSAGHARAGGGSISRGLSQYLPQSITTSLVAESEAGKPQEETRAENGATWRLPRSHFPAGAAGRSSRGCLSVCHLLGQGCLTGATCEWSGSPIPLLAFLSNRHHRSKADI